jgi:ankyrin repeat protein
MTIVKLLLEHGTKVNHTQNDGATSLYIACEEKHLDIVKLLVDYDADPTIGIHTGISPMYNACEKENLSSVELFLKNKVNPNGRFQSGCTPLSLACTNGYKALFCLLLSCGADVAQNYRRWSYSIIHCM